MKVLLINGSPRREGNTRLALEEVAAAIEAGGVETEIFWIGNRPVQGCTACNKCGDLGRCVFKDEVYNALLEKIQEADGLVIGSPTFYAGPNGALCALLDRLFYSASRHLSHKPGTAVAVCRRGGSSAALDRLNKYFAISNMPMVPSQYWNLVYGHRPGDAAHDGEGLQTMRMLGRNMVWMLRNLASGAEAAPAREEWIMTSFIR